MKLVDETNNIDISSCIFNGNNHYGVYSNSSIDYYNVNISNNEFNECSNAVYFTGPLNGLAVLNNVIMSSEVGSSIRTSGVDSLIIYSNKINSLGTGIYIYNCIYTEIEKNEIYLTGSSSGIYLEYITTSSENSKIINNVISTLGYGIYFSSVDDLELYYNSVLSASANTNRETFYFRYCDNLNVKNNIFVNTGQNKVIKGYSGSDLSLDYNSYYALSSGLAVWDGTTVNGFSEWQSTTGFDSNSLEANPVFISSTDLHPNQSLIDGGGVELVGYNEDIEGTTRDNPPDMGAYEFTASGDNAGILSLLPQTPIDPNTYPVSIELFNSGPNVITTDSLYWTVNDVAQPPVFWTGNLAVNSSETVTLGDYQFDEIIGYEIKVWSSSPNGQMDIDQSDDTLLVSNLYTTLAGDYTIGGANPDFQTLAEASNALNNGGVSNSVRLLIRNGTYEEQISFGEIYGSSETNTLTIQSETGNAVDAIIQYDAPYNSNDYYLMKFDGTDNIIIKNLTFEPLGNSYNLILKFENGTNNVHVDNCVFNGHNSQAIYVRDIGPNFKIENSEFFNGNKDIDIRDAQASNSGSGINIEGNVFNDDASFNYDYNIYIHSIDSLTIQSNEIYSDGNSSGINIYSCDNVNIEKNRIYLQGTGRGINMQSVDGLTRRSNVVNNFISSAGHGLYFFYVDNVNVYFNSLRTDNASFNYYTFYWRYSDNLNVRNNIFANEGGGVLVKGYSTAGLVLDYNNYYTTGAVLGVWDNSNIANFTDWEFTTQQDANSLSIEPLFQGVYDLHSNNIALNAGVPIAEILDDIDGDTRNSITPYIGADESPIAIDDIGIVNLISPSVPFPQGTNELVINVVNNFTTSLNSATINWIVDTDTMAQVDWTGNIPSGTADSILVGTYQFDVAQPYDLKFWLSDPNGITDSYNDNDTLEVLDLYAALIGTYTIGSNNADFETISQAVEALEKGGIVGEVIFNIQDGIYQENIEINEILGASVANNIIFQSESMDSSAVIISNLETTSNTIFHIDSTDYISLKHLTFEQSASSSYCVRLSSSNENVNINNCHFNNSHMAVWIEGLVDNFEFTENNIDAGTYGVYCATYNTSSNVLIENNIFTNQSNSAIRMYYFSSPIIQYNKINVSGTTSYGIYLSSIQDEFRVIGNELYLNDATAGIRVSTLSSNASNHGLIGNNFISINGVSSTYGLEISGNYIDIFHNNILVESTEVINGRAIQLTGLYTNLKNNILVNTGGGYCIVASDDNAITESDYNNFYAPGGRVGYWNGNRSSLGNWQAGSGLDANSFDVDPEFISSSDLHISQQLISEKGTPVDGLPEDIDGDFRNPLTPDIGADEFTSLVNNIGVIEILTPITGCDISANDEVTIVIKKPGSQSQSNFDIAFQLGNDAPIVETFNQTLDSGFTANHTFTTPINLVLDSIYTIKAYTLLASDELTFNDTTTTSVISYPPVNITISPDETIDYGDTLVLTASGGTNYAWSGDLEGENPYSPTLTVAPYVTQTYQMTVTDDNGCEATESVTITVNPIPELPDLIVSNVNSGLTTVQPGDPVTLTWDIGNIGDGFGLVEWTEKIYIQSLDGSNRTIVGQVNYDGTDTIAVNEILNRSYDLNLPDELSIGDQGVFVVEIVTNILELPLSTANNITQENQAWTIERILYLSIADLEIEEGSGSIYCIVSRSGSTASSLTVNIDLTDSQRFNFPSQLTIYNGQAGRSFYISASDNDDLEGDLNITMTASATNFTNAEEELLLIDDEIPSLFIDNLPATLAEGEVLSFDISTNFPPTDSLFVNIISSEVADVPLPTPVVILPGNTSVNVEVTLPDDDFAEPVEFVTITAGSAGIESAIDNFTLTNDEDIPAISFELTIDTISESSGLYATQGIITRLGNTDAVLQVDISSNDPESLYMPSTVPLGPGEMEKSFYIGIFDNLQNEGFRDIEITASVLIGACNCTASSTSAGVFSDILTVADDDGPTLMLTASPLSILEGVANTGTLTITRNTATDNDLTVTLSSSDISELVLPSSVTIPAGAASIDVPLTGEIDGEVDGNQEVSVQAGATGFNPGIVLVIVTDNNKPDFQIVEVELSNAFIPALKPFPFKTYIINTGFATAPSGAILEGYLSENTILEENDILVGTYIIDEPLAVGDTLEVWDVAIAPYEAGPYYLIFEINPESSLTEIQYLNNTSPPVLLEIEPDYFGTAIVDELTYLQGENITIYGSSTNEDGTPLPNAELEIYVINGPIRQEFLVTTDANGDYSMVFEPLASDAGHFIVGASFSGMGATDAQDEFDILGVEVNANDFIIWEVLLNEAQTGVLSIKNRSDFPLTNVSIQGISLPPDVTISFDTIPLLEGNEILTINYTVTGTEVSPPGNYLEIPLQVISDENMTQEITVCYFCQAQEAHISAEISSINRTISQTQSNFLEFRIFNNGEGETGDITVDLPSVDFMSLVNLDTMPSIASGDTSIVIIEFIPTASLPLNTPATGTVIVNAVNGNYITIPYAVEKVSEETGGIIVDVVDEYTYFTDEAPHVENAHVKISHYFTGEIFAEGYTDADGSSCLICQ